MMQTNYTQDLFIPGIAREQYLFVGADENTRAVVFSGAGFLSCSLKFTDSSLILASTCTRSTSALVSLPPHPLGAYAHFLMHPFVQSLKFPFSSALITSPLNLHITQPIIHSDTHSLSPSHPHTGMEVKKLNIA